MTDRTVWLDRVTSTQDVLHGLAADGAPDGTAVVAVEQTDGRGSRGRSWNSGRGGLWLSVLSRSAGPAPAEALSVRAALGVAAALDVLGVSGVAVKWPNDLMLDDRKLGGILCEARWLGDRFAWVVIGVGLNVTNTLPDDLRSSAIALAETHPAIRAGDLAIAVIEQLRSGAAITTPLADAEQSAFVTRDWLAGRALTSPAAGIADGVDPDGALRIRRADGTVEVVRVGPAVASTH